MLLSGGIPFYFVLALVIAETFEGFAAEFDEGVLHDVSREIEVAREARGIPHQRTLVRIERLPYPCRVRRVSVAHRLIRHRPLFPTTIWTPFCPRSA